MNKKFVRLLSVVSVIPLAAGLVAFAQASSVGFNTNNSNDSEWNAYSSFSDDFGIPLETAQILLDDQEVFGLYLNSLENIGSEYESWLSLENGLQTLNIRTLEIMDVSNIKVSDHSKVVLFSEQPITTSDFEEIGSVLIPLSEHSQLELIGYYVDVRTGNLHLDVNGSVDKETLAEIENKTARKVVFETREGQYGDNAQFNGGSAMAGCTSGYTATIGSSIGLLSAAHCSNQTIYNLPVVGGSSTFGTKTASVHNANADIAFFQISSSHTISNHFYMYPTFATANLTPITLSAGNYVCAYGINKGYRCGNISSVAYVPTWTGACPGGTCNPAFINVPITSDLGDSGGPWWFGSGRTQGIHKGGGTNLSVFSKIQNRPASTIKY